MLELASETITSRREIASRGRVGVDRGERSVVTGIHGLQHVERFFAADLADDDAVRPHTQAVDQQFALPHRAVAFEVGGPGFEARHMRLLQLQFGGVFDGDDALLGAMNTDSAFSSVVFPAPVPPDDDDVQLGLDGGLQQFHHARRHAPCAPPDRAASACRC